MQKVVKYLTILFLLIATTFVITACNSGPGEVYEGLVGRWTMGTFTYTFNADGTGRRTGESFTWGVRGDTLRIHRDAEYVNSGEIRNERWDFSIGTNNRLNLRSQQERTMNFNFYQIGVIDMELVGTWEWNDDPEWRYVFNDAGGGNRGYEGDTDSFRWGVVDGNQLRIFHTMGGMSDSWNFTITGDSLWLGSGQQAGVEFYYTRR